MAVNDGNKHRQSLVPGQSTTHESLDNLSVEPLVMIQLTAFGAERVMVTVLAEDYME
jgi:hypothetical protein